MKLFKDNLENIILLFEKGYLYCANEVQKEFNSKVFSYIMKQAYNRSNKEDTFIVIIDSNLEIEIENKKDINNLLEIMVFYRRQDIIKDKDFTNIKTYYNVIDWIKSHDHKIVNEFPYVENNDSTNYRWLYYHFQANEYNTQQLLSLKKINSNHIKLLKQYRKIKWKNDNIVILFDLLVKIYKNQAVFYLEKELYQQLANIIQLYELNEIQKAEIEEKELLLSLLKKSLDNMNEIKDFLRLN